MDKDFIVKILGEISRQLEEGYCILPSDLKFNKQGVGEIKDLAQERFPSIPLYILDTLEN